MSLSATSPTAWPLRSLIALKWSMSPTISDAVSPGRHGAVAELGDAGLERDAAEHPGQRIDDRRAAVVDG